MEEFNKNIEGIRRMMSDLRNEKYAIVNPDLVSLDEYMKILYLKVLCTVVQLGDEPTEMQVLFLKRIVAGIGVEDPAEEYMRRALEISDTDMQEFLTGMKENRAKYYFALDGLILVSIGTENQECYQYLAEIIELLDICKDDLKYVCLAASSVLQQQSSFYDEAKELTNERIREVDYTPYIQNFYAGAIKDSMELVYYSAPDKKYSESITFRTSYTEKRVVFENLDIDINERWEFNNCNEVIFMDCKFAGGDFSIEVKGCKKVFIDRCRFENFNAPVFKQERNVEVTIENCEFEKCIGKCSRGIIEPAGGGVIYSPLDDQSLNIIRKTIFRNCGGRWDATSKLEGVLSNCLCKVYECTFYNCHHYGEQNRLIDGIFDTLFRDGTEGSNNELSNSIDFS